MSDLRRSFLARLATAAGTALVGSLSTGAGAAPAAKGGQREMVSAFDFMSAEQIADVRARTRRLDCTGAIGAAIADASARRCDLYFPSGDYLLIGGVPHGYVLAMKSNVRYIGDGPEASVLCLPAGAANPPTILGGRTYARSVRVIGLGFDGGQADQSALVPGRAGAGGTGAGQYEFSHGICQLLGDDILVEHCIFKNFQGDGVGFGTSFAFGGTTPRVMKDLLVTRSVFENLLREGVFLVQCDGAEVSHSHFKGRPYVAGVDLERHHVSDVVRNVNVSRNTFEFDVYRRAVSCLVSDPNYLYEDGNSVNITIDFNRIVNGQIDVRSFSGVDIIFNKIENGTEDIPKNPWISRHAIYIDPVVVGSPANIFGGHRVIGNEVIHRTTLSGKGGFGIYTDRNRSVKLALNAIRYAKEGGILMRNARDMRAVENNITDVGSVSVAGVGIQLRENCESSVITGNIIRNTKAGISRTVSYGVSMEGVNGASPPIVANNQFHNMVAGDIKENPSQRNFSIRSGNVSDGAANAEQ